MIEHDFEPIRGLPGDLPAGESILWQGAPRWWAVAKSALLFRPVALYFLALLIWRVVEALSHGVAPTAALISAIAVSPLALVCLGLLSLAALLISRTTVYTVTNKRVVMRFGLAVPKAINIPFKIIDGAALKASSDGVGDIALTLRAPNKLGFLHLWPHARPWRMAAPQPTFIGLDDAPGACAILTSAMQKEVGIILTPAPAVIRTGGHAGSLAGHEVKAA